MKKFIGVVVAATVIGGFVGGELTGDTFTITGAVIGGGGVFTVLMGLGAFFTAQEEKKKGNIPPEIREIFGRMAAGLEKSKQQTSVSVKKTYRPEDVDVLVSLILKVISSSFKEEGFEKYNKSGCQFELFCYLSVLVLLYSQRKYSHGVIHNILTAINVCKAAFIEDIEYEFIHDDDEESPICLEPLEDIFKDRLGCYQEILKDRDTYGDPFSALSRCIYSVADGYFCFTYDTSEIDNLRDSMELYTYLSVFQSTMVPALLESLDKYASLRDDRRGK